MKESLKFEFGKTSMEARIIYVTSWYKLNLNTTSLAPGRTDFLGSRYWSPSSLVHAVTEPNVSSQWQKTLLLLFDLVLHTDIRTQGYLMYRVIHNISIWKRRFMKLYNVISRFELGKKFEKKKKKLASVTQWDRTNRSGHKRMLNKMHISICTTEIKTISELPNKISLKVIQKLFWVK